MQGRFKTFLSPHPRRLDEMFSPDALDRLRAAGDLAIHEGEDLSDAAFDRLAADANVIVGSFDLPEARLARCPNLRAVVTSEGNFLPNVDYAYCFRNGVRVLSGSPVFAEPVAEIGLAMAIDLGRGITRSDRRMRAGTEGYGFDANRNALTLFRADVGFIGFGDLARALLPLLRPFGVRAKVYDPWMPEVLVRAQGCEPASLDDVLETSDFVFVLAGVTVENQHFLGAAQFARMRPGAAFLLLSRAAVVDFPAMLEAADAGRIRVATDVFPEEPVPMDDPARRAENVLLSPHQAGALKHVLAQMGDAIASDIALLAKGLPPLVCKQAQPETASRLRSMPVSRS